MMMKRIAALALAALSVVGLTAPAGAAWPYPVNCGSYTLRPIGGGPGGQSRSVNAMDFERIDGDPNHLVWVVVATDNSVHYSMGSHYDWPHTLSDWVTMPAAANAIRLGGTITQNGITAPIIVIRGTDGVYRRSFNWGQAWHTVTQSTFDSAGTPKTSITDVGGHTWVTGVFGINGTTATILLPKMSLNC